MTTARNSASVRLPRISIPLYRSASVHLSRISNRAVSPQEAQQVLTAAFTAPDYIECSKNLTAWEIDPQAYIDGLDQLIDTLTPGSEIYKSSLRALIKACGIYGILPSSHLMPPGLTLVTAGTMKRPFASGGFSDVWKARNDSGQVFAIKNYLNYGVDNLNHVKKKCYKEVVICRRIRHENVLNAEGIAPELFEFCMVFRWMKNGNMLHYVRTQGQVDRMSLLLGITRGLCHLHSSGIIHGDLKSPNILIDEEGRPLLADFGLSSIMKDNISVDASTPHSGGTIRWSSPELLDAYSDKPKNQTLTTKSDIYALAMVIIELYTGNVPFPDIPDPIVLLKVARGERPSKPIHAGVLGLTPAAWKLTRRCWHKKPVKRPDTSEILAYIETFNKPKYRSKAPNDVFHHESPKDSQYSITLQADDRTNTPFDQRSCSTVDAWSFDQIYSVISDSQSVFGSPMEDL